MRQVYRQALKDRPTCECGELMELKFTYTARSNTPHERAVYECPVTNHRKDTPIRSPFDPSCQLVYINRGTNYWDRATKSERILIATLLTVVVIFNLYVAYALYIK